MQTRKDGVTFLSKTTVAKILNIIGEMSKQMVVKDVNDAGVFSTYFPYSSHSLT